jgi:hypothetical protein
MNYGASPEEWFQWDCLLGATADLLPVVCRPGQPIAKNSALQSYGKVPSLYVYAGNPSAEKHVIGMPAWTARKTTSNEIDRWSQEPDYGICLQTRVYRALDVDIADPVTARAVRDFLTFWGSRALFFPLRFRADSAKFLILFRLLGEYPKQVLPVGDGMIEFLANGQQCLVAGTHKDGARYEWVGLDDDIPELTHDEFVQLKEDLAREFSTGASWSEGRLREVRGTAASVTLDAIEDPVVAFLKSKDLITRVSADGRIHTPCPWSAAHTAGTDPTASTYFPAGTGGYETGHYLCLHAHCQKRLTSEFLLAIGYTLDGFEDLTTATVDNMAVLDAFGATDNTPSGNQNPIELPRLDRDTKTGAIKWTLPNIIAALGVLDEVRIAFDLYTDRMMIGHGAAPLRPFTDDDYTEIALLLYQGLRGSPGFIKTLFPIQLLRAGVHRVAMQNKFDSAIDWLESLPAWDGRSRISGFCANYLGAERSPYSEAVSRYWWTAHAGRVLTPGVQADMAIVLISGQGTGKTSSLKAIVPGIEHYVEINLTERDDDLARAMRGRLIGELGELRGLGTRDNEAIKAFVSRQREVWTPKYMEMPHTFARRLVLVGTSNQDEFLADETGNRRWLPIEVGAFQDRDAIIRDRDQLWAEAADLYKKQGVLWEEAQRLARGEHSRFEIGDPWDSAVEHWLYQKDLGDAKPIDKEFLTIEEVLREALHFDLQRIHHVEKLRMGKILRKLGFVKKNKRSADRMVKVWVRGTDVAHVA